MSIRTNVLSGLILTSVSGLSFAALSPELEKASEQFVAQFIECQKEPLSKEELKELGPILDNIKAGLHEATLEKMAELNEQESKALLQCVNSLKNKTCDEVMKTKTPECAAVSSLKP